MAALSRPLYLLFLGHGAAVQSKGYVTFKRQNRETEMRWGKISLGFSALGLLIELAAALSNEAVFEAQFLNVSEELKVADEKYGGYEIIEHRVSHRFIDPQRPEPRQRYFPISTCFTSHEF